MEHQQTSGENWKGSQNVQRQETFWKRNCTSFVLSVSYFLKHNFKKWRNNLGGFLNNNNLTVKCKEQCH